MKKDSESSHRKETKNDSEKNLFVAADLFSRLSPQAQDELIDLVKRLLSQNDNHR